MSLTIGRRIADARQMYELSQAQLGLKIGVTREAISYYEKGENQPLPEKVDRLARLFDCDASWLLTGDGQAPRMSAFDERPRPDAALIGMTLEFSADLESLTVRGVDRAALGRIALWLLSQKAGSLPKVKP